MGRRGDESVWEYAFWVRPGARRRSWFTPRILEIEATYSCPARRTAHRKHEVDRRSGPCECGSDPERRNYELYLSATSSGAVVSRGKRRGDGMMHSRPRVEPFAG